MIPRLWVRNYSDALSSLSESCRDEVSAKLALITYEDIALARDAAIAVMNEYLPTYTDAAAVIAANFYEICREHEIGGEYEAIVDSCRVPEATDAAVRAMIQKVVDGRPPEMFVEMCLDRCDYEIRKAAAECTMLNCEQDPWGAR